MKFQNIKEALIDFFSVLGICWLLVEIIDFFFYTDYPDSLVWIHSNWIILPIIILSIAYSSYNNWPYRKIRYKISGTDVHLTIRYGNIVNQTDNIVIASSNLFNTSSDIISKNSILAQYIGKHFKGANAKVDNDLSKSLKDVRGENIFVSKGKCTSYPVGTIAVFETPNNKKGFLVAITQITENGGVKANSNISYIHQSLNNLWDKVEAYVDNEVVNMTPLGSGISKSFSRLTESILYISQSFIDRARKKRPCRELVIFVRKEDLSLSDYLELRKLIKFIAS